MKEQMQNVNIQGADEDIIEFVKSYYAYESEKKETHQETKISSVNLTPEIQKRLADKLTMLPHEARCVLFGQYCFHMTFFDIHETYGINKPEEVSDWYKRVLAKLAGLNGKQRISEESFAKICDEAMARYIKKKENDSINCNVQKPLNRRRMDTLGRLVAVAAAIVIAVLFSAITVKAGFREKLMNWITDRFDAFTSFYSLSNDSKSVTDIEEYSVGYIPTGYTFLEKADIADGVSYLYEDKQGNIISIFITLPSEGWLIDTEGLKMQSVQYEGNNAYYYYDEHKARFVFFKDGYPMYILGNINIDECLKIADGIKK